MVSFLEPLWEFTFLGQNKAFHRRKNGSFPDLFPRQTWFSVLVAELDAWIGLMERYRFQKPVIDLLDLSLHALKRLKMRHHSSRANSKRLLAGICWNSAAKSCLPKIWRNDSFSDLSTLPQDIQTSGEPSLCETWHPDPQPRPHQRMLTWIDNLLLALAVVDAPSTLFLLRPPGQLGLFPEPLYLNVISSLIILQPSLPMTSTTLTTRIARPRSMSGNQSHPSSDALESTAAVTVGLQDCPTQPMLLPPSQPSPHNFLTTPPEHSSHLSNPRFKPSLIFGKEMMKAVSWSHQPPKTDLDSAAAKTPCVHRASWVNKVRDQDFWRRTVDPAQAARWLPWNWATLPLLWPDGGNGLPTHRATPSDS